jgi:two-component system sensor histidine kinase PilS (NtrC family)
MPFPFSRTQSRLWGASSSQNWFVSREELLRKTQWLILWRLVFISIFLLLTVLLQEKKNLPLFPFSFSRILLAIAGQYVLSIFYIALLIPERPASWKAAIQLLLDGCFVTAVVYWTGGIESFFPYLYFLIIVAGGTIFYRLGGLLTALYAAVLYGMLLLLQGLQVIPIPFGWSGQAPPLAKNYFLYQFIMHGIGFFCVGYISSFFVEQTRKQWGQIEDQKKSIDQLEELNRIVIENLEIGLITLDSRHKILNINPAGRIILGQSLDELKGVSLNTIFREHKTSVYVVDPSLGNRLETSYETPKGSKTTLGYSLTPVRESSAHGIGEIVTFKDISQLKAIQEHLRQVDHLAMMGKMAAGIAHEIRNPLAAISGSIQVLKDESREDGTGERLLKIISREVARLDSLMNDFLAFAKPAQALDVRQDISDLILETVELIRKNQSNPPGIHWEMDIRPNLPVKISSGEVAQVLWNLLMNALQALPAEGRIRISAQSFRDEADIDWIRIKISDNGPGIPLNDQSKIFDPFFTTKDQGTGLGLSIVQKIISDRGGMIRVESPPGQGTDFIILFPRS